MVFTERRSSDHASSVNLFMDLFNFYLTTEVCWDWNMSVRESKPKLSTKLSYCTWGDTEWTFTESRRVRKEEEDSRCISFPLMDRSSLLARSSWGSLRRVHETSLPGSLSPDTIIYWKSISDWTHNITIVLYPSFRFCFQIHHLVKNSGSVVDKRTKTRLSWWMRD